jgi:hypothetical protein
MRPLVSILVLGTALLGAAALVRADPARDAILAATAERAKQADPAFAGFDAARGEAFWRATHPGGKPDTPSCTTCHGPDPRAPGQTRAGKVIEPMAVSVNPKRLTDPDTVAKWLGRNCNSVLGRDCTPLEQGDVLTYLSSQ